jgi:hypothetical protein
MLHVAQHSARALTRQRRLLVVTYKCLSSDKYIEAEFWFPTLFRPTSP